VLAGLGTAGDAGRGCQTALSRHRRVPAAAIERERAVLREQAQATAKSERS